MGRRRAEREPWAARSAVPLAAARPRSSSASRRSRFPLLKKPMEVIGKQVGVKGAYWDGRQTDEEKASTFMCSVVDYSISCSISHYGVTYLVFYVAPPRRLIVRSMPKSHLGVLRTAGASLE